MKVHENIVHYVDMCPVKSDELKRDQIFFSVQWFETQIFKTNLKNVFLEIKTCINKTFLPCKKKYKNHENLRQIANC